MIHNLWISRYTGECLLHRKYGSIEQDENLITSFLSAIEIFAQNVDSGCDFLQTKSYKFVYTTSQNTVTVACVDKDDDEKLIKKELEHIQKEFVKRFQQNLENWNGDVSQFRDISDYVDHRLKKYRMSIDDLENAKLELTDPMIIKKSVSFQFSPQQQKVISLLKYKGSATLNDIARLMKLSQTEAEKAARSLLYNNIIKQVPSS